ncbi:hypothetical protein PZE06_23880 [Robertmurraya sp. DFI.2.37]|uniref:hypothetical protein n=1 Tax=Robertmurraya sp. DFI.2.37 TaxID=3031819 RepID=UPI001245B4AD|nr:hypothetical protein [Robertmurraya sp. DFI.2.37]MDF1511175.1 hypothetical protein [Robertmurraya sp. DFI.2.37]
MKNKNLIFIEEAMKHPEVVRLVSEASERIWYKLNDVTSFEHTCYRNIGIALKTYDYMSLIGLATRIIRRAEAWHIKNRGATQTISIQSLAEDGGDNGQAYEVADSTEDIESKVLNKIRQKEIVTKISQGDERKKVILNLWYTGYINDSELSVVLAERFGNKTSGHRRFIQRFKVECQRKLAAI